MLEADVVATKDFGFGNEDLDCGSKSDELPHLSKKKTSPSCVVTKVNPPSHMQGSNLKEARNLSDVQVLEVNKRRPPTRTQSRKKLKRDQVPNIKLVITSPETNTSNSSPNTSTRCNRSPFQYLGKDLESNIL